MIANQEHCASYRFDVVPKKQQRLVWIHRDQQEEQTQLKIYEEMNAIEQIMQRPCIQPVIQICQGDNIEIAINFFSM